MPNHRSEARMVRRERGPLRKDSLKNPLSRPPCARHPLLQGERGAEFAAPADDSEPDEQLEIADSPWPDLVLIDGGHGQLTAARETLAELGVTDVPLVGIAKGPDRDAGRETFFVPGREPFKLPPRDPVLYFVQRLRDEAHRFAIGSHRAEAQEGHPRGRPAGDPRHRPDAQARAAAPFRHPEGDRARLGRRPRAGSRHQRRDRAQDLDFFHESAPRR